MAADSYRNWRSIRLRGFDYTQPGAYFVTLVTYQRECLLGEVTDGDALLSKWGEIVREEWIRSGDIRAEIELDEFVIMPNHIHAIVAIVDEQGPVGATSLKFLVQT